MFPPAQEKRCSRYTLHAYTFIWHGCGEDRRKLDCKSTLNLEARIHELQGKTAAKRDSFGKITSPVSIEKIPRQSRRADLTSDPSDGTSGLYLQKLTNKYSNREGREILFISSQLFIQCIQCMTWCTVLAHSA